jgi:hypothetical protein
LHLQQMQQQQQSMPVFEQARTTGWLDGGAETFTE